MSETQKNEDEKKFKEEFKQIKPGVWVSKVSAKERYKELENEKKKQKVKH